MGGDRVKNAGLARILIAEDEPSLANLYKLVLERYGHQIIAVVSSGDEVVRLYESSDPKPDLLILDHRLERIPGLEALKKILEIDPNAKILFASADDSVMEDAIEAGAVDYIGKPFSMSELVEVVSSCIS
jgi:two-component system, chemotaxis family, chemotaxis protein CheY